MRWAPHGIGVKVALAIVAATLVLVGTFGGLMVREQRRLLRDDAVRSAALLSDTIRQSTHHAMLDDRREDAYRIMGAIGSQPGIEGVRVFNKEGRITWSSHPGEAGTLVDKRAESCYACHAAGSPITRLALPSRARLYAGTNGHRVLAMVTPIYNEPSCSTAACHAHPPSQTVLGVVDVGMSMEAPDAAVARLSRTTAALSVLTVVVLAGAATLATRALVVKPVQELETATRRIASGQLDEVVPVRTRDELGELAVSFNQMRSAVAEARGELENVLSGLEQQVQERTESLRAAEAQLGQAERMASLGRLSASIAHEINNPLAGILTFSKLLIRGAEADPDSPRRETTLQRLRLVERETTRCAAIVRNLLDFARQKPLVLLPVDLVAVVEEALSLVGHRLTLENVTLVRELAPLPPVRGDFGHLRQAVVNLVMNACDATPAGGTVRVASRLLGREAEVEVVDTGAGISPEDLKKIFEPFFSTKEKGTGLGLAVVYGIVQRHGGAIDVRSTRGQGTSVSLRLPVA